MVRPRESRAKVICTSRIKGLVIIKWWKRYPPLTLTIIPNFFKKAIGNP